MRIEISGRGLEITDAIRDYADTKCQKLLKFYDGVQEIEVVLDQERRDHHDEFTAEIIINVVKHNPLVAKADGVDVYASIDVAIDKATRQLTDFKKKLREHH